jgi:hypothetical protein
MKKVLITLGLQHRRNLIAFDLSTSEMKLYNLRDPREKLYGFAALRENKSARSAKTEKETQRPPCKTLWPLWLNRGTPKTRCLNLQT